MTRRFEKRMQRVARARDEADRAFLAKLKEIVQRQDCPAEQRARGNELIQALEWWIETGRSGHEVHRPPGTLAIEGIVDAWRASRT